MQHKNTKEEIESLLKILESDQDKVIELPIDQELRLKKNQLIRFKPQRNTVVKNKSVFKFIKEEKIAKGTRFFEAFILYYYFQEWCRTRKNKIAPTAYKNFCNILGVYFPKKINTERTLFFGIGKNLRKDYLNPNKEIAIRRWHDNDKRKKEKQKRTKRISQP